MLEFSLPFINKQEPEVRIQFTRNGGAIETVALALKDKEAQQAYYAWNIPVREGWVHYAVQYKEPVSGLWYYCDDETFKDAHYEQLNGLIKFQEDIRGDRVLGMRPAVYNLRLDTNNQPLVDENGNLMLGTFDDLRKQLIHLKKEGFDHIYIQALENGAPGEAGPDASPFSPLSQVKICERIGGLKGLLALKKTADEVGIEIALDMIPHFARSNREINPRQAVWVFDQGQFKLVRRAASDGGLSPDWLDGAARNWVDPRNVREYINDISYLAKLGFNMRVDIGHVFDTTYRPAEDQVGMAKIRGNVVVNNSTDTTDLRFTWEPSSVLGWITYEVKKAALEKGYHTKFFGENWHGHEPRLIQSGIDFPFDPLVANLWNVVRDGAPSDEYLKTHGFIDEVTRRFGGATITAINNHDAQVPPVDAFKHFSFVATGLAAFANRGLLYQHSHYSFRNPDGSPDLTKQLAEVWGVAVNNFGPARVVNGVNWPGFNWEAKIGITEDMLRVNPYLHDLGGSIRRVHSLSKDKPQMKGLYVGHERIASAIRYSGDGMKIGFFHQGSPYAADINFTTNELMCVAGCEENSVYELHEIFDNARPAVNAEHPGDKLLLTGKEIANLGIGPRFPLPIAGMKVYNFKRASATLPDIKDPLYKHLLKDSLMRYKRYGPKDRFECSFIAREIFAALKSEDFEKFHEIFDLLASIAFEDDNVYIGDITSVFGDIITYDREVRTVMDDYLIRLAIVHESDSYLVSEMAIQVLRSADIGEVVLVSPESLDATGSGGLALYIRDISRKLADLGVNVTVIVPLFQADQDRIFREHTLRDTGRTVSVKFNKDGSHTSTAKIYEAYVDAHRKEFNGRSGTVSSVRVLYLQNDEYFHRLNGSNDSLYDGPGDYRLRAARMLSLGALLTMREMNLHPRTIMTNEWPSAFLKAYLEGRERIDQSLSGIRFDPHLADAKVMSIFHNLHKNYHGKISESNQDVRNRMIENDLGFDPSRDWDVLFRPGEWEAINPTYAALITSNFARTVSKGYHDRSLDMRYNDEFGGLVPLLQWKNNAGCYDGVPNGFDLVGRQQKYFGRSFFEIGDKLQRKKLAYTIFNKVLPQAKRKLQRAFRLKLDKKAFIVSMLHRVDQQKGHQLLLEHVWDKFSPDVLVTKGGWFESMETTFPLSKEQKQLLIDSGNERLRALEVLCILIPELQFIIAGKADDGYFKDEFMKIEKKFPKKVRFIPEYIKFTDPKYDLIYTGSTLFDMPSFFEPGGLSNQEAAASGVVRHITRRDGLQDGEVKIESFAEGFVPFNPVAWTRSLLNSHHVWETDPKGWDKVRFALITQDNRWLKKVKVYAESFRKLAKRPPILELDALEIQAAIHRSIIKGEKSPLNELVMAGYTSEEVADIVVQTLQYSRNEFLLNSLRERHLPVLLKVKEISALLEKKLGKLEFEKIVTGVTPEQEVLQAA
jgi:glycogen synthase